MTPEQLAEARRLAEEATPGPWKVSTSHGMCVGSNDGREMIVDMSPASSSGRWHGKVEDARFIAASRQLVPALLSEVNTLRATAEIASAELATAIGEVERLKVRQQELLATLVKVTQTTPFADEAGQVAVLIAEVGTLKAAIRAACDSEDEHWAMDQLRGFAGRS